MAITIPQFCLPIIISGGPHVEINFAMSKNGPNYDLAVTLSAGTYFNARNYASAEELLKMLADDLTTAEAADGTDGTWVVAALSGGTEGEARLTRSIGGMADDVTSLTFMLPTVLPATLAGFTSAVIPNVVPYTSRVGIGDDHLWDTDWLGRLWIPYVEVTDDQAWPVSDTRVSLARNGSSESLEVGEMMTRMVLVDGVFGALINNKMLSQAVYRTAAAGSVVLSASDTNAPLEHLWREMKLVTPLRFYPDYDDLATYDEIEVVSTDWLNRLKGVAEELDPGYALYKVPFDAVDYVA